MKEEVLWFAQLQKALFKFRKVNPHLKTTMCVMLIAAK